MTKLVAQVFGNTDFLRGIVPCGTSYAPQACTVCHFFVLLQNIINFFLFVVAPIATIIAVYAGFLFITSGGSPQRIESAKKALWSAVVGTIIVLASWMVINTVLNIVANQGAFPWPWNQIQCGV